MLVFSLLVSLLTSSTVTARPLDDTAHLARAALVQETHITSQTKDTRAINPIYASLAAVENARPTPNSEKKRTAAPQVDWSDFEVPGGRRAIDPIHANESTHTTAEQDSVLEWYPAPGSRRQLDDGVDDVVDWSNYEVPTAINPIYLNVSHDEVYKRAESGPIYGPTGKPDIQDVHQTTNPSCGFASVMAAIADANPDWIADHVTYSPSVSAASTVKVQMYDPTSLALRSFDVTCAETAQKSDVDPATGIWWPGAYDHAGVKLGLPNQNGAMGGILPGASMQAITGKKATAIDKITADVIFDYATKADSLHTPVVLQTKGGEKTVKLVGGHAYALLSGEGSGSNRTVTLYNPWGSYKTLSVDSIVGETIYVWHLNNLDSYTAPGGGGKGFAGQIASKPQEVSSTQLQEQQQQGQATDSVRASERREGGAVGWTVDRGDPTPTDVVVNAVAQPTHSTTSNGVAQAVDKDDGVVWVTEVVTVFVGA